MTPELILNTLSEKAFAFAFQFQSNHLVLVTRHGNRSSESVNVTTYASIKLCANDTYGSFANTRKQACRSGATEGDPANTDPADPSQLPDT